MKIVLINPPWYFNSVNDKIISQNLAIGYLASYLRSNNIEVSIIDSLADGFNNHKNINRNDREYIQVDLSYSDICARIESDVTHVGITVPFSHLAPISRQLAKAIKEFDNKLKVVIVGVFPSTFPEEALIESVDYVIRGEGEKPLLALMKGQEPDSIPGLVYKINGIVRNNGVSLSLPNLDEIPFPARDMLPVEKYFSLSPRMEENKRAFSIITSRGCPYDCNFCSVHSVYGYKWRGRSPSNVIDEVEMMVSNYNINHIEFEDDNLTLNKERAESIFDGLIKLKRDITWSAHNGVRVDTLDKQLIRKMGKSGCVRLNLAIESGNKNTLSYMNKKLSLEKVTEVVRYCSEENIRTTGFLLVGYPGETKESFAETLTFFKKLLGMGLTDVAPFIVNPYPGTKLYDNCRRNNLLTKQIDSDHFFSVSDTNNILISTDKFNKNDVALWFELANNINNPYLAYLRVFIKKLIPNPYLAYLRVFIKKLIPKLQRRNIRTFAKYLVNKCRFIKRVM
jgi:anaerobic magnesium-protoporphyrin IX monomethyl ester cyclase